MSELRSWDQLEELEQLEITYCEMYKDVYGIKARWYKAESVEQAKRDLEQLGKELEAEMAREEVAQQEAIKVFEELVQKYGREEAKRYQHQAYDTRGDDEFLCYCLGLPYGYFNK